MPEPLLGTSAQLPQLAVPALERYCHLVTEESGAATQRSSAWVRDCSKTGVICAQLPPFCWYSQRVRLASNGLFHSSVICVLPAVAVSPATAAGVGGSGVALTAPDSPLESPGTTARTRNA